jgi:nucleoside 2-deoxyribosyltransferase
MNLLNKTKTYLIGPMEFGNDTESWRKQCEDRLSKLGIVCFNPHSHPFLVDIEEGKQSLLIELREQEKYDELEEAAKNIRRHDLKMVDKADFLICHIDPTIPTIGTIDELVNAERLDRPVFMFIEGGKKKCPTYLFSKVPHKYMYDSLEEILETIEKIDSGEIEIDSKRWKLMKECYR